MFYIENINNYYNLLDEYVRNADIMEGVIEISERWSLNNERKYNCTCSKE